MGQQISDLTTEHSFDLQATYAIDVLGYFSDMLSVGVCTNIHLQTSCRLMQILNVCTVERIYYPYSVKSLRDIKIDHMVNRHDCF